MKTIHKYELKQTTAQTISVPQGADFLHAGLDANGSICVWAMVDPNRPLKNVTINIFGTGHVFTWLPTTHLGSFVQDCYVWHVFIE